MWAKAPHDGLKSDMIEKISSRASKAKSYEEGSETMYAEFAPHSWTRENIAWMAGIFEGEGYVQGRPHTNVRSDGRSFTSVGLRLAISMTDEDVVRHFHQLATVGTVRGPRVSPSALRFKPLFDYTAYGIDAYALMMALFSYLGTRRQEQVRSAITAWKNSPGSSRRALTDDQVRYVRSEVSKGTRGVAAMLAKEFGISHSAISLIARRKTYGTVKDFGASAD